MADAFPTDDMKPGICDWCGDDCPVYTDNNLCEDCENDTIWCCICESRQPDDSSGCRHVFRTDECEWAGAGTGWEPPETVRKSFDLLLSLMPAGFAADLKKAIKSGRFHTWLIAPLIGGGGILELHGMPERDGRWMVHEWGDAMIEIGEGDKAEETHEGYRWLVSLYDDKTPDANRRTISWIDEREQADG